MTGYNAQGEYELEFTEPQFAGLEITTRGASIGELFELDRADMAIGEAKGLDEVEKAIRARNALFVDKILSWNLEVRTKARSKAPVPVTVDSLCDVVDSKLTNRMIRAWRNALSGVPAPLDKPSESGGPQPPSEEVESTLTGIPSESLAS